MILALIGGIFGAVNLSADFGTFYGVIIGAGVAGSLWTALKFFGNAMLCALQMDIMGILINLFLILICPIKTAYKIIKHIVTLVKASQVLGALNSYLRELLDQYNKPHG